jgi:hypothetical protein
MADEKSYSSKSFLYQSRGLGARWEVDRVPDEFYLQNLNCFERSEGSLSSRYGTQILNRDAYGSGTSNHFFTSPVTSLARLLYQSSASRFAGLADGTLWQGPGYTQGPYAQIYSGLSGQPFTTVVTNCYQTSQPFLFIADQAASIKIPTGSSATPQLWGIDPPPQTANSLPFSPLLTLIDNFSASNTYSASGFSASNTWAYAPVTNIPAGSGSLITDFPQFVNIGGSVYSFTPSYGASQVSTSYFSPTGSDAVTYSGFSSQVVSPGEQVAVTVVVQAEIIATGGGTGNATMDFQYSPDGGATWITFFSWAGSAVQNFGPQTVAFTIVGLTNLDLLQFQIVVGAVCTSGPGSTYTVSAGFASPYTVQATITDPGIFGTVCDGILSVLNNNSSISIPISSIDGTANSSLIQVTTTQPHNRSASDYIALYGTSNPLLDGFYPVASISASNSFGVDLLSTSLYDGLATGATGGYVVGGAAAPSTCVLADQYSTPYPTQFSAWGFYQQVPLTTATFPIGSWTGLVDTNTTATVGVTADFDLSYNNQVTDSDLIVLTLKVSAPANIASIMLQFDVNSSGYTSSYYTTTLSPAYYQGSLAGQLSAYQSTQNQVLADALGLLTGQQPLGSTTAQLSPSNFSTGSDAWIAVLIPRGNFLPVGQAGQSGLDWSNITGWKVVVETTTTAITGDGSSTVAVNGLYLQWGYGPSSFAGVGYDWRYTYYSLTTGTESSPSPIQQFNQQYGYLSSLSAPFYLRQAAQVSVQYSSDSQVTHVRAYRRGGIYGSNWFLTQQFPNVTAGGQFTCKDVTPDASLSQAQPLALDNDPPVTSSLVTPIQTTLLLATASPGSSVYSTFLPQSIVLPHTAYLALNPIVPNQVILIGNAYNLEEVIAVTGSQVVGTFPHQTIQFSAVVRLQHNAGEPVQVNSTPRQPCSLCALSNQGGVTQVWLAGDKNNPHYLYYSKPGRPENFSPAAYIPVSSPDDPIMAVVNWRGTIVVGTTKTWWIIVGGAKPYPQPTGAAHGMASSSWTLVEGEIIYQSQDGLRAFSGADGQYMTLPVEWMFRESPATIIPKFSASDYAQTVLCQYQNQMYASFVSASNSTSTGNGARYRLRFDIANRRFGLDDVPATATLWEQDTNALVVGKRIGQTGSNYAVVQDWIGDYDDGGWQAGQLVETPIHLIPQTPFRDLGKPHFPKQWNMLEGDYATEGQDIETTLFFNTEPEISLTLPTVNTGSTRSKVQYQIPATASASNPLASGVQAYAMSVRHDMYVTVAPTFYQEDVYAVVLADYRTSFDTYWQGTEGDLLGIQPKNIYCDYTATTQLTVSIYADGKDNAPYYVDDFTLIPQANRSVVRVQLPARKGRLWRAIITATEPFQLWAPIRVEVKTLGEGSTYEERKFPVYQ